MLTGAEVAALVEDSMTEVWSLYEAHPASGGGGEERKTCGRECEYFSYFITKRLKGGRHDDGFSALSCMRTMGTERSRPYHMVAK